ncbi:hypothetical protein GCWU000325_02601 [Alloprevotella tannerae ATCC 51259]|uniref:Uncharacterized protein n=1 Tax=Alloprevotella tannerae ATCC 51259 TaxID=626522 RepID=C9LK36_9BACT|nr:hypothetical protein GCWU000325_02601 [Alloprevotella tannerae ATCC 51259]
MMSLSLSAATSSPSMRIAMVVCPCCLDSLRPLQKSFYTQKLLLIINELYL